MKLSIASIAVLLFAPTSTLSHPQVAPALQQRDILAILDQPVSEASDHWKRKGGGGGGGRGGGGGGSRSSGSSGSRGSSGGRTSSSGSSRGSGVTKNYGGGRYYGGGATAPYSSGRRSPRGIVAVPFIGAGLLLFPALAVAGAYSYPYYNPYTFYNRTARRNRTATTTSTSASATATAPTRRSIVERFFEIEMRQNSEDSEFGVNQTKPVNCLCAKDADCGCDDNGDTAFLDSLIGDGDWAQLNKTLVQVADINGTSTILIDGTLPDGTVEIDSTSGASSSLTLGGSITGYFVMLIIVSFTCFLV